MGGNGIDQLQQRKDRRKSRTPPPPPKHSKATVAVGYLDPTIPSGRASVETAGPAASFPKPKQNRLPSQGQNPGAYTEEEFTPRLSQADYAGKAAAAEPLQHGLGKGNPGIDETSPARRLVLAYLGQPPSPEAHFAAHSWFRDRGVEGAVDELLELAVAMGPNGRDAVLELISLRGTEADKILRRKCPPILRPWLRSITGSETEADDSVWEEVQVWLAVEEIVRILESRGAGDAYTAVWRRVAKNAKTTFSKILDDIVRTGHPEAEMLVQQVSKVHVTAPARKSPSIYRLKMDLAYSRFPVWRSVVLPADANLELLHEVIQILMGWGGGNDAHRFELQTRPPGEPSNNFRVPSVEYLTRLDDVFEVTKGERIAYDYAGSWRVYIAVEEVDVQSGQEMCDPLCVEGVGFPEVSDSAQDPPSGDFDVDFMNARLSSARLLMDRT
ncbi:plasmid pRiA4b ORF-3 family protein [Streptomyces sp. NPDC005533]|uniref:plasmid pRiA4b ORF-3 family protein n=1 Tax=Streptomyces sp. NPDC005533 TaxID=3364723 RepID=UPI0036B9A26C